jgi:PAS domain S-box-containing protein
VERITREKPGHQLSAAHLQAVIDGLEDELLVIDRDYRLVHVNQAVLKRHGKSYRAVIGRHCYDVSHGLLELCHPPRHECPITRVWETGKPSHAVHLHLYEVNGEQRKRYVDIIASPIFDSQGRVAYVVELMRDVTEAKLLEEEVQRQVQARGELLNQLFSVQEEERKRLARELHDEPMQSLAALAANLEAMTARTRDETTRAKLKSLQAVSLKTLDELHRLIYELRPVALDDFGLMTALRSLAQRELERAGIGLEFRVCGKEKRLPVKLENTLYRVVQEAVSNIVRHSRASHCTIALHFKRNSVMVHITDDGIGFDVADALTAVDRPRGLGLLGMKERIDLMNGKLEILSGRDRKGTEINITVPLAEEKTQ